MSSVTKAEGGSSFFVIVAILVMVAATAVVIAPAYDEIRLRSHAVEQHGMDAVIARLATRNCANLKAFRCPSRENHPPSFFLICEEVTGVMCTVMIVGTKGGELTSMRIPCERTLKLISDCSRAAVQ